ncbi:MAG: hypothetical protein JNM84_26805 [Planctomycetes bacterium]|nr:hypothetical protein [Planctomycetota bacterium]
MRRRPSTAAWCAVLSFLSLLSWDARAGEPSGGASPLARAPRVLVVEPGRRGAWSDLQSALDAAQADDVVWVRGGEHPPIRIEKGVHLLAAPAARIRYPQGGNPKSAAAIEIRTTSREAVTLAGITVEVGVELASSGAVVPAVRASGCGRLVLIDCRLEGAGHAPGVVGAAGADGAAAVEARGVEQIWVSRCRLSGGAAAAHASHPLGTTSGDGGAGLSAPDSVVLALRSSFAGGAGGELQILGGSLLRRRAGIGGRGGIGLAARLVLDVGSRFEGGNGGAALEGRRRVVAAPEGEAVLGAQTRVPDQLEAFAAPHGEGRVTLLGLQAWGELSVLACADRLEFDELLAGDESFPFLDLRTALHVDAVPSAEVPVAPGLVEVLFELEGRAVAPVIGIPMLVQQVRQSPSGEVHWSNPEIVLRWPALP